MTHAALSAERRAEDGIPDGLVRLSAGIEPIETLVADLVRALDALPSLDPADVRSDATPTGPGLEVAA